MKKVFLDTNILIDYLARRGQFFEPAAQIVQLGQQHEFGLLVSAMSFATASFILEAHHKLPKRGHRPQVCGVRHDVQCHTR